MERILMHPENRFQAKLINELFLLQLSYFYFICVVFFFVYNYFIYRKQRSSIALTLFLKPYVCYHF